MTSIVLTPISTGYNISNINANFNKLQNSINTDVVNRAGGNNVMFQDLDLNGHSLLNASSDLSNPSSMLTVGVANATFLKKTGDVLAGTLNAGGFAISGLRTPVAVDEPIRKDQFDALSSIVQGFQVSINSGLLGYQTQAAMNADLNHNAGAVALVTNDSTPANNTTYIKVGGIGTGSWQVSFDRITNEAASRSSADTAIVNTLAASSGSNTVGFLQSGTGAVSRTVQSKNRDIFHVNDFGAIADYDGTNGTDNSSAINAAILAMPAYGGKLVFGRGAYKIASPLTILNKPIEIVGEGREATRLVQVTASTNAINFTSSSTANAVSTNGTIKNTLTIRNISILRGLTSSGIAVNASWVSTTDNMAYFTMHDVMIYGDNNGGLAWSTGVKLTNVNGTRITNVAIKGSVFETSLTPAFPYTMNQGIYFTGATDFGHVDHHISGLTIGCCNNAIQVDAWYEGIYLNNFEFVQVGYGVNVAGFVTSLNPVFCITNGHMDFRQGAINATNQINLQCSNLMVIKNGGAPVAGFAGNVINLVNSSYGHYSNVDITNYQTAAGIFGIVGDSNSGQTTITGCSIRGMTSTGVQIGGTGWNVASNNISANSTGVAITGSGNIIGYNNYVTNTTNITDSGGNNVPPQIWSSVLASSFASAGVNQTITIPIPAGVFVNAPRSVFLVEQTVSGNQLVFSYNRSSSTATSLSINAQRNDGASIGAGVNYSVGILATT